MSDATAAKFSSGIIRVWLAGLLASALLLQLHLVVNLDFDGELLSTDAESLYGLRCVRDGECPYHDFSRTPHVVTLYGPLFYGVPGTVARLLNTSWIGTMVCGRGYTYAAWLGVGLVIYALGRQIDCGRSIAAVSTLLWLSGTLAWQWAVAYRPDAEAILLSLGGLWVYQRDKSRMAVAVAIACLVAAFLHKQSSVAVLLAIVTTEVTHRRWGRAATVFGGWMLCVAVVAATTQALSNGAFMKNALGATMLWVSPGWAWSLFRGALAQGVVVFAGGTLACVLTRGNERLTLLRRGYAISLAVALVTSVKAGGNLNYYLEPFALACALTGGLLRDWVRRETNSVGWGLCAGWLGLAIVVSTMNLGLRAERLPEWWRTALDHRAVRAQQAREWDRLTACLGEVNERVLVEDSYVALRQSRELVALHARQLGALREAGRFDDSELLQRIADGGFDTIIANFPMGETIETRQFPQRWLEAARGRYVLEKRCERRGPGDAFYVYHPAARAGDGRTHSANR